MTSRLQTVLTILLPILLAATALTWASAGSKSRIMLVWLVLTVAISGSFLATSQGSTMDWPRWGTVLGIALIGGAMLGSALLAHSLRASAPARLIMNMLVGMIFYYVVVYGLVLLAPGTFGI